MDFKNPRYKNQGLHVDVAVFTVMNKQVKVFLVRRANKPAVGTWMLPGGGVYNNESIDFAAARELAVKTGIKNVYLEQVYTFGEPNRDPRQRLAAVAYLALVDSEKIRTLKITPKILDSRWFALDEIPKLLFDHKQILQYCLAKLRQRIMFSNIAANILPTKFTLPELHELYQTVLGKQLDRRNFRKKILSSDLIKPANQTRATGRRPAELYAFKDKKVRDIAISI